MSDWFRSAENGTLLLMLVGFSIYTIVQLGVVAWCLLILVFAVVLKLPMNRKKI